MKQALLVAAVLAGGAGLVAALPPAGGGSDRGGRFARLKEDLGLSDQQETRLREIREGSQRDAIRRRADVQVARLDLRHLMEAPTLDRKAVDAKVKEVSDLQAAGFRARVDTMLAMREVLTPDQMKKWQELRGDRRMGDRPRRGPRGRRMGMGGGPADPGSSPGPDTEER